MSTQMVLLSRMRVAAGCGGLPRDHEGKWLGGLSRNLGSCHAFMAELRGVMDGL